MLRYFFPPAFRIPKDDVNSMTAEELVSFPLVRDDTYRIHDGATSSYISCCHKTEKQIKRRINKNPYSHMTSIFPCLLGKT